MRMHTQLCFRMSTIPCSWKVSLPCSYLASQNTTLSKQPYNNHSQSQADWQCIIEDSNVGVVSQFDNTCIVQTSSQSMFWVCCFECKSKRVLLSSCTSASGLRCYKRLGLATFVWVITFQLSLKQLTSYDSHEERDTIAKFCICRPL